MPYKTQFGTHYHVTEGCHGAIIPCNTAGLRPCGVCCSSSAPVVPSVKISVSSPQCTENAQSSISSNALAPQQGEAAIFADGQADEETLTTCIEISNSGKIVYAHSPSAPQWDSIPSADVKRVVQQHLHTDPQAKISRKPPQFSMGITPDIRRYLDKLRLSLKDSQYLGTPFEEISLLANRSKGAVFEHLVEEFYSKKLHQIVQPHEKGNTDHDRIINGQKTEIKGSSLWQSKEPLFKWQQIRPYQDYEQLVFLAMYPTYIDLFQSNKADILACSQLRGQHVSDEEEDLPETCWLSGVPEDFPELKPIGRICGTRTSRTNKVPTMMFNQCSDTQGYIAAKTDQRQKDVLAYYHNSPFRYFAICTSTSTKGAVAESIGEAFLKHAGYNVGGRVNGTQADRSINGKPLEIKAATRGSSGTTLLWEQIRPSQDVDNYLLMDIDQSVIRFYLVDRQTIENWRVSGRISKQHCGKNSKGKTCEMHYAPHKDSFLDVYQIGEIHA